MVKELKLFRSSFKIISISISCFRRENYNFCSWNISSPNSLRSNHDYSKNHYDCVIETTSSTSFLNYVDAIETNYVHA